MLDISNNIRTVREKIITAAVKANRNPNNITLVAVSKRKPVEDILLAAQAGITEFGENRVQELLEKQQILTTDKINWHFIGHLQTNKVRQVIDRAVLIHSLDSWQLAAELDKRSQQAGIVSRTLVEVNVSREETKEGLYPEEVPEFLKEVADNFKSVKIDGLMTIAPYVEDSEEVRWVFKELRILFEQIKLLNIKQVDMNYLSMGMSNDFTVAIEEGANIIRIGTDIFGVRSK